MTIKIRAWHKVGKIHLSCDEMAKAKMTMLPDGRFFDHRNNSFIEDLVPELWTGFFDYGGIEIYDHDKVKYSFFGVGVVHFPMGRAAYIQFKSGFSRLLQDADIRELKVVGYHDNQNNINA